MKTGTEVPNCRGLSPGTQIQIQLEGLGPSKSQFIGMTGGEFLIIKTPLVQDISTKLFQKNHVIIRYLHEGSVYGFRCTLIGLVKEPYRLSILSYPETIECLNLRKHERVECLIKASLKIHDLQEYSLQGIIQDISLGGCGFKCKPPEGGAVPQVEMNQKATISMDFPGRGTPMELHSVIRRVQQDRQAILIGTELDKEEDRQKVNEIIRDYIDPFRWG